MNAALMAFIAAAMDYVTSHYLFAPIALFGILISFVWLSVGGRIGMHVMSREDHVAEVARHIGITEEKAGILNAVDAQKMFWEGKRDRKPGDDFAPFARRLGSNLIRRTVLPVGIVVVWILIFASLLITAFT